jgi:hypothetical protein
MERILTNSQVEWLAIIKALSEYEDEYFPKDDMSKKLDAVIESTYPGEEISIISELKVLKEHGFLTLESSDCRVEEFKGEQFEYDASVEDVNITKKGSDYLVLLNEENPKSLFNTILARIKQVAIIGNNLGGLFSFLIKFFTEL